MLIIMISIMISRTMLIIMSRHDDAYHNFFKKLFGQGPYRFIQKIPENLSSDSEPMAKPFDVSVIFLKKITCSTDANFRRKKDQDLTIPRTRKFRNYFWPKFWLNKHTFFDLTKMCFL